MSLFASSVAGSRPEESASVSSSDRNQRLNQLIAQRELLETEADAIGSELTSPGLHGAPPAGIKTPLVDKEGFPRGDIDIYRVKLLRGRLACINTDHKRLMKEIGNEIHSLHQSAPTASTHRHPSDRTTTGFGAEASIASVDVKPQPQPQPQPSLSKITGDASSAAPDNTAPVSVPGPSSSSLQSAFEAAQYYTVRPFATLDQILAGGPAHSAGLQDGDALLRFGDVMLAGTAAGDEAPLGAAGTRQPVYRSASSCMEQIPAVVNAAYQSGKSIRLVVRKEGSGGSSAVDMASSVVEERVLTPRLWSGRGLLGLHLTPR